MTLPTHWMTQALALAERSVGLSDPNPRVGCVILSTDGRVFEGHTQEAGGPHAEVVALRAARAAGADLRGATVHVTLEPCSHHGRTPPCCHALIEAGVGRVVAAMADPNPLVAGQGLATLRAAGIAVEVLDPAQPLAQAAHELNIGFISRMTRGLPWVRMKIAASLDGSSALHNGQSQWITGAAARTDGHAWRRRAGALLTGIGTVQDDDPRLDVRLVPTARQPMRVVVDSPLAIAPAARILQPPGVVRVYTVAEAAASAEKRQALAALGVQVVDMPAVGGGGDGGGGANGRPHPKIDLHALLQDLAAQGVNELHIEAGHKLNGSFLREGLVDELLVYLAPCLLGPGAGLAHIGPFESLDQRLAWRYEEATRVGDDLRLRLRRA